MPYCASYLHAWCLIIREESVCAKNTNTASEPSLPLRNDIPSA